jgi:EspG family
VSFPDFAFRPAPQRDSPPAVSVLDTTCEGIFLLQALCNVESLPAILLLRPFVAVAGVPTSHPGMAVLREAGVLLAEDVVHPRIAEWMDILGAPDMQLCGNLRRGEQYLRLAVARRDDRHIAVTRCGDDITVEEMGRIGALSDLAARVLPLAGPAAEPARFSPITVPTAGLLEGLASVVNGEHTPVVAFAELSLTGEQRRILMLAADAPVMEFSLTMVQHDSRGDHIAKAAVTITDTAEGRVVTGPLRSDDGAWLTQISPGTDDAIGRALRSLVSTLPSPAWRDHSRMH